MTTEFIMTRENQITAIVNGLKDLGYKGDSPIDVIEESEALFSHRDISGEVTTDKVFEIAHLLIRETPYFPSIEKVIEFIYQDGGFDIYNNVSNWSEVGEQILFNDSQKDSEFVIGFINPEYLKYVDKEAVGKSISYRSAVNFDKKMVIRVW